MSFGKKKYLQSIIFVSLFIFLQSFTWLKPKTYKFELTLPYDQMWQEFITDFQAPLKHFFEEMEQEKQFLAQHFHTNYTLDDALNYHDQNLVAEIQAISSLSNISFFDLFLFNFYLPFIIVTDPSEVSNQSELLLMKYCTSIVVQNSSSQIYLIRNFDEYYPTLLQSLTAQGEFYYNGSLVFTGQLMAGSVGIHTGLSVNGFAIANNARLGGTIGEYLNLIINNNQSKNVVYLLRKTLEQAQSYDEAVQMLSNSILDVNVYYIVVGKPYEGVIITRSPTKVDNLSVINNETWYLVQTNIERNDLDDPNRQAAEKVLNEMTQQKANITNVFNEILAAPPNNEYGTVCTVAMAPYDNFFQMVVKSE